MATKVKNTDQDFSGRPTASGACFYILLLISILLPPFFYRANAQDNTGEMVFVKGGKYVPLYGNDSVPVEVNDFEIDKYPVTNIQYEEFLLKYPKWNKNNIKRVFADQGYLKHWGNLETSVQDNPDLKDAPIINVSWFAAKAYCECQGKRLPNVDEWEYAAAASEDKPNASNDTKYYNRILDWYSKPNPKVLPAVQTGFVNYYGIYGMIGLVWEWTLDYNSALLIGESRANASLDRNLFCGAGSRGAKDTENYVAFMRYAFRSSLKSDYTVSNLGFRCAK